MASCVGMLMAVCSLSNKLVVSFCCIMFWPHGAQQPSVGPAHHVSHDQEFIAFHSLGLPISATTIDLRPCSLMV